MTKHRVSRRDLCSLIQWKGKTIWKNCKGNYHPSLDEFEKLTDKIAKIEGVKKKDLIFHD